MTSNKKPIPLILTQTDNGDDGAIENLNGDSLVGRLVTRYCDTEDSIKSPCPSRTATCEQNDLNECKEWIILPDKK